MYEEDTEVDAFQLFEKRIYLVEQFLAFLCVCDYGVNHFVVTLHHAVKLVFPFFFAVQCQLCCGKQLVRDASEGTHYDNHRLFLRFLFYNSLQAQDAFNGTY